MHIQLPAQQAIRRRERLTDCTTAPCWARLLPTTTSEPLRRSEADFCRLTTTCDELKLSDAWRFIAGIMFGKSNIESRLRRGSYQFSVSPGQNAEYKVSDIEVWRSLRSSRSNYSIRFISLTSVRKLLAPRRDLWLKPSKSLTICSKTKYYFYKSLAGPDGQELLSAQRSKLALNG
jgi:hypothetical protein